jgi:uncharacterized protein (TIGR02452 family)
VPQYYERHRASPSLLYSDAMILSPDCPVFRRDDGEFLEAPILASFITAAAPNAGAIANSRPDEAPSIPEVLRRRSEYVLALAASRGYKRIVLGAWAAVSFATTLRSWQPRSCRIYFAVRGQGASHA